MKKTDRKQSEALLTWFDACRRDLPWRRTRDPYAIWVSEIMLQQTRVETVVPYFEKFLDRFPAVAALAAADEEEVLATWSGLGYYRRARLLHRAARQVVDHGGALPRDIAGLRRLPGIGAYTAAAIGSIAFGLVAPAIDGNVERVISRYLRIAGDPRRGLARRTVEEGAAGLLDEERPGDSNQALMELGASICRPRNPRCSRCPLRTDCVARSRGEQEVFPKARDRRAAIRLRRRIVIVRDQGRLLLFRRADTSETLAGLWELPWVEHPDEAEIEDSFAQRYGGRWIVEEPQGQIRHSITHRSFEIEVCAGRLGAVDVVMEGREAGWFTVEDLERLPVSSLVRKALAVVGSDSSPALAGGE